MSNSEHPSDVLEKIGWGKYNYYLFTANGMIWLSAMLWNGNISIAIKEAGSSWSLTNIQRGMIGTIYTLGLLFGSIFWGYLGNTIGRLRSLYYNTFLSIISGVGYTVSLNYPTLCFFCFFIGFFFGGSYVLAGSLYSESIPKSKEWTLVLLSIFLAVGGILCYFLAFAVLLVGNLSYEMWRYVGAFSCVSQVICLLFLLLICESPKYLISQNKVNEAKQVLEKIAKYNRFNRDISIYLPEGYKKNSDDDVKIEIISFKSFEELFKSDMRRKTLTITLVMLACDFPWSALNTFMPILLTETGAEITNPLDIYLTLLIKAIFSVPGTILASYLVTTRLGKKWTAVIGYLVTGVSVFLFFLSDSYSTILVSACFLDFFNIIGYASLIALVTESFPAYIRSLGLGYANSMIKLGAVLSPVLVGFIFDQPGGILIGIVMISVMFMVVGGFICFMREASEEYLSIS